MTLIAKKYADVPIDRDLKYCMALLNRLGTQLSDVKLVIYKDYPNISQGKMIKEIPDALNKDINVADLQKNISELLNHIFEFKFKININNSIFDGFLRRNNYSLSKIYGSYEFDIFGNSKVSNFGDLILSGNENLKSVAEAWITKDAHQFKVQIQEAYIAPSSGDPEIDISKRIWMYYVNPADFVGDVIKFIKHFEDIESPVYMKEEYKKISDRLKPYNDKFLAS